jgi:N utilization substance protein A
MMSKELLLLVDILAREKNLEQEVVFQSLEKALVAATRKNFVNERPEIEVVIDRTDGTYKTLRRWNVLADNLELEDEDKEIHFADATIKFADVEIGDVVEEEISNVEFGRISAYTARNIITQKIKDAEREQVLHEYLARNRGIIVGKAKRFDRGDLIVECGRIEAIIMKNDLIPKEVIQPGMQVKGFLDKNKITIKNGKVLISRTSEGFLEKLLDNNVPEISTGRVVIKGIARIPGVRAKVSVVSLDRRLDAKGACIGFRNQRIDNISAELANEKIDIIDYDEDLAQYTINALAPAEIASIVVDEKKHVIEVTVEDTKLGVAIGLDGENVRLASKLVGYTIDVLGVTATKQKQQTERAELIELFNNELNIDDEISAILVDNGFTSVEEVAYVNINELIAIDEFDEDTANQLQERAKDQVLSKNIIHKDAMDKLALELNDLAKLSRTALLKLVEAKVLTLQDLADLSGDELVILVGIDIEMANTLIMKARELSGYFDEIV